MGKQRFTEPPGADKGKNGRIVSNAGRNAAQNYLCPGDKLRGGPDSVPAAKKVNQHGGGRLSKHPPAQVAGNTADLNDFQLKFTLRNNRANRRVFSNQISEKNLVILLPHSC
jgi:hypothetical protein